MARRKGRSKNYTKSLKRKLSRSTTRKKGVRRRRKLMRCCW